MDERLTRLPDGVSLGPLSERVFEVLSRYTVFPWPVMVAQARRLDVSASDLRPAELQRLLPNLAAGVERFTSPEKGEAVRRDLLHLLEFE
jgi:hypothetical protein